MMRAGHAISSWCTRANDRTRDRTVAIALALMSYLPMLLTSPGRVSADTKTYLTLDPGAVIRDAPSMWDPSVGAGTVPHQNIGYLFPLGPYYWVMETLGVPDWLTQRLLWGTLVFAAAYGMYRLARWLGWTPVTAVVTAVSYGFSPYLLSYLARLSVILGPWAALPWMILLAAKAARTRSWRPAAQFALVVALVGSVNATALVLAGLGPIIWLVADVASGRVRARAAISAAAKIGVLSAAISLWWIMALRIQGSYGIPILRYTETYESVAGASTPTELIRGLGYWFFYGGDRLDAWVGPQLPYIDNPVVMALGFTIAAVALLGFLVPFIGRASAAILLLVGLAVSAGAAPLDRSTPYGAVFHWFASDTTAGLALRSTPRALPLVVLALAFGLGSSAGWLRRLVAARTATHRRRWDLLVPVGFVAVLALQLFPWFTGTVLTPSILRDEDPPGYETDLAAWLDRPAAGRGLVYEMPAADFANYRWGGTIDPVLPGLIERPYLARELVPQGGAGTADLLNALERRLPEGWFEPEALTAVAQRLGVETIVARNDIEHERYRLARPDLLWTQLGEALGDPDHAGALVRDTPQIPVLDERTLAHPEAAAEFPVVAAFDVGTGRTVQTMPASTPIVLAGSGDGIVDLAGAGLLDPERPLLYAATLDDLGPLEAPAMIGSDTWWVLSDTNRKQGRHWSTVSSNLGALEADGPLQLDDDPGDSQLDVFLPGARRQTIAVHEADVADVRASYYGNRIAYTPEDAPWFAIDGDPTTAWRAGVFDTTSGLTWEVDLAAPIEPVDAASVTLLQPTTGAVNRYITEVRITLDDDRSFDVTLDETSRTTPGQAIALPPGAFRSMRIEVLADNVGELSTYGAQPGVGLAEVTIPGVRDDRVVRVPGLGDFAHLDTSQLDTQRLTYLLTRERIDPATSNRSSPEQHMVRRFDVPAAAADRAFELTGEVRLSGDASEETLQQILGDESSVVADRRLRGSPASRGASAFDGDLTTAWQTPFDEAVGATLSFDALDPVDAVTLWWRDDGRHSVPTEIVLGTVDGASATVTIPPTSPQDGIASTTVALSSPTSPASEIVSATITAVDARTTPEYFSGFAQVLPVGLVELQFGSSVNTTTDADAPLDSACRDDLLLLDGDPLAVRLAGTRGAALARDELQLSACDPLDLTAGSHRIEAAPGARTGFDVDRIVIDSPVTPPEASAGDAPTVEAPTVEVDASTSTSFELQVAASAEPAWLILRQSWNPGWTATVDGVELDPPVLVDGFANGWLLPASSSPRQIALEWTPQRTMRLALWFSLFAGVGIVALVVADRRRADRRRAVPPAAASVARRPSRPVVLALLAGLLVGIAFFAGPLVAVGGLAVAIFGSRWRWLAPVVVAVTILGSGAAVVLLQWRYGYAADPDWPNRFAWTSSIVWLGVVAAIVTAFESHRCTPAPQ